MMEGFDPFYKIIHMYYRGIEASINLTELGNYCCLVYALFSRGLLKHFLHGLQIT